MRISQFKGLSILLVLVLGFVPVFEVKAVDETWNVVHNPSFETAVLETTWCEDNVGHVNLQTTAKANNWKYSLNLSHNLTVYQEFDPPIDTDDIDYGSLMMNGGPDTNRLVITFYYDDDSSGNYVIEKDTDDGWETQYFSSYIDAGKNLWKITLNSLIGYDDVYVDDVEIWSLYPIGPGGTRPQDQMMDFSFEGESPYYWTHNTTGFDKKSVVNSWDGSKSVLLTGYDDRLIQTLTSPVLIDDITTFTFWVSPVSQSSKFMVKLYFTDGTTENLGGFDPNVDNGDWYEYDVKDMVQSYLTGYWISKIELYGGFNDWTEQIYYDSFHLFAYDDGPHNAVLNPGWEIDEETEWTHDEWANDVRLSDHYHNIPGYIIQMYSNHVSQDFASPLAVDNISEFSFWRAGFTGGNSQYILDVHYNDTTEENYWVTFSANSTWAQIDITADLDAGKFIESIQFAGGSMNSVVYDDVLIMYEGAPESPPELVDYIVNLRRYANDTIINDPYYADVSWVADNYFESYLIENDGTILNYKNSTIATFEYPKNEYDDLETLTTPTSPITPIMDYPTYRYVINLRRYENGTVLNDPYYASIVETDGYLHSEYIDQNGVEVAYKSTIFAFTYPLSDPDEFRTLYSPAYARAITPIIPGDLNDQYLFTIRDLTGYLVGKTSTLEVWKNVDGDDVIIDSALVTNTVNGIPLRLTRYALVYLKLLIPNGERYDFGSFMPTGNPLTVTLVFNYTDLEDSINHYNEYVSCWAERSLDYETITVDVENTLTYGFTFTSSVTLYMRNGTVVDTQSSSSNYHTFTFANLTASQDYIARLTMTHSFFGSHQFKASWTFAGSWSPDSDQDFPDPTAILGWTFGGVTQIIGVIIVLVVAGLFSYVSAPVGIMFTILVSGMLGMMGILTISAGTLALVFSLGVILILGRRNQNG